MDSQAAKQPQRCGHPTPALVVVAGSPIANKTDCERARSMNEEEKSYDTLQAAL
jgi:hypothetical protein